MILDDDGIDAYDVPLFCARHAISRSTLYNLLQRGAGPRIMRVGSRRLISREAAADWRRQCETCTGDDAG